MEEFYKTIQVGQKVEICGIDQWGTLCEAVVVVTVLCQRPDDYGFSYRLISGQAYENIRTVGHSWLESGKVTVYPYHEEEDAVVYNTVGESGRVWIATEDFESVKSSTQEVSQFPTTAEDGYSKSHYEFDYILTEKDQEKGMVRLDPYFVSKQWKLGSKDETGIIWHCLKTIARFGVKNSKEREIKALYNQIKRLAELEGVNLEEWK